MLSATGDEAITAINDISITFSILASVSGQIYTTLLTDVLFGKFLKK